MPKKGELGQFAYLREAWQERGCFQKGACPIMPMVSPRDCCFSHKSMLKNVPAYLQSQKGFSLKRIYSANIIWCILLLRYTSIVLQDVIGRFCLIIFVFIKRNYKNVRGVFEVN